LRYRVGGDGAPSGDGGLESVLVKLYGALSTPLLFLVRVAVTNDSQARHPASPLSVADQSRRPSSRWIARPGPSPRPR